MSTDLLALVDFSLAAGLLVPGGLSFPPPAFFLKRLSKIPIGFMLALAGWCRIGSMAYYTTGSISHEPCEWTLGMSGLFLAKEISIGTDHEIPFADPSYSVAFSKNPWGNYRSGGIGGFRGAKVVRWA